MEVKKKVNANKEQVHGPEHSRQESVGVRGQAKLYSVLGMNTGHRQQPKEAVMVRSINEETPNAQESRIALGLLKAIFWPTPSFRLEFFFSCWCSEVR
jgi:hypothetical protein